MTARKKTTDAGDTQQTTDASTAPGDEVAGEQAIDFEQALAELEQLVDQMEDGELSLEASLAAFERGVRLTRLCQSALRNAELKVRQLTRENTLEDLSIDDTDDD